jgi:hypothetical protein
MVCSVIFSQKMGAKDVNARATLSNSRRVKQNGGGVVVVQAIQDNFEMVLENLRCV